MNFTDIFVRRPVLATVISLLILIVGLRSISDMEVRQYPEMRNTVVTVTTVYPGASSELVKGFITTPLQQAIAEANGIDYISATSSQGFSKIEITMELNYDANAAVAEIQSKVASKRNVLPAESEDPVIDSTTGDSTALMYITVFSDSIPRPQVADYVLRVVQPQLQALSGVAKARMFSQEYAMRIWLDPQRMAALNVTPSEVIGVLQRNNFLAAVGSTKDKYVSINLTATTDVSTVEDFDNLVVRDEGGTLVRLRDVAATHLGAENYSSTSWYRGKPSVFMAMEQAPGSNPLTVAQTINAEIPKIRAQLPDGMDIRVPYDASQFIEDSIDEVFKTLGEAMLIVLLVIFLSLGSMRAAMIPAVAVPLSLIGGAFVMLLLGFSLNLLTLLAMVLAIGLVVDDAIIIVENVHRHIEMGESKFQAAIHGAREMAMPIFAMTITVLAVFIPIGFQGGLVGALFSEFAFTLTATVFISAIVALTLSPMLASKVLKPHGKQGPFELRVENFFAWLSRSYERVLSIALDSVPALLIFTAVVLVAIVLMFMTSRDELAPTEDQGILFFQASAPRTATLEYHEVYAKEIIRHFESFPEYLDSFIILGMTQDTSFGGFKLNSFTQRERTQMDLHPELQQKLASVPGFQTAVFPRPSLPGGGRGFPIQMVLTSDRNYDEIGSYADQIIGQAMESGQFMFLRKSLDIDLPSIKVVIDRNRAGDLGISMLDIGRNLGSMLGGGYINRFNMDGRSYKVVPQVLREARLSADDLNDYYIRTGKGDLVPLSTVVQLEQTVEPSTRTQFQQLNSIAIEGVMMPAVALGTAIEYLEGIASELLPRGYDVDHTGVSRQFKQEGSSTLITFALSMIFIYLTLAALYESWRDPAIILVTVPLSIFGAMIFLTLGFASINIYTKVGLITLIGVVAKNGILIVEFANKLQINEGLSRRAAVTKAAVIRLRPILMTASAMVFAMFPLLTAAGPGAVSRFDIGLTVVAGLAIGTIFTLFVLPAFYVVVARDHAKAEQQLRAEEQGT
ncbi:MAG: efflux RND transporter permease subunit [Thiohalomonadaceae bacterium]